MEALPCSFNLDESANNVDTVLDAAGALLTQGKNFVTTSGKDIVARL